MSFAIFIAIASAIVIAGHVFIYFSWVHFLKISTPAILMTLRIALGILSVSFLASSFLIHWRDNFLTAAFYAVASVWLGVLLYLFLATIVVWLVVLVDLIPGVSIRIPLVAGALLIIAAAVSIYGLWNASNPKPRHIEVTINNLPPSWQGRKAVQISDVHLGVIHGRRFLSDIVDKINRERPDIVFITGDLFDGVGDDLAILTEPLNDIRAPLGTYFITGNHETYLGINKALTALADKRVNILRDQIADVDGVQLVGLDYPVFGGRLNIEPVMSRLDRAKPNIVLFHSPIQIERFRESGANFQLAGHTHKGQLWPLNFISDKVYGGKDDGIYRNDGYTLYTSVGTGTWGPPMRTGNQPEITVITFR